MRAYPAWSSIIPSSRPLSALATRVLACVVTPSLIQLLPARFYSRPEIRLFPRNICPEKSVLRGGRQPHATCGSRVVVRHKAGRRDVAGRLEISQGADYLVVIMGTEVHKIALPRPVIQFLERMRAGFYPGFVTV